MPTYEFKCHRCGAREEFALAVESRDITLYCECGTQLTRVFSPAGIVFKGSGFYRNDSRPLEPKPKKDKPKDKKKKKEKVTDGKT